jgi:two-component sensor histidine kinase
LRDEGGRRVGFVGASIGIDELREILDRGRTLDGARAAIVDMEGRVIAQSSVDPEDPRAPGLPTTAQIRNMIGPQPRFLEVQNGAAVVVPLHEPDLYAVMSWAPTRGVWRNWIDISASVAAPLLIWLFAIAAGWFAIEIFVARPLSALEAAARGFARGEEVTDAPAMASAPDEIRSLRRTLVAMAKTLRGREQRLVDALGEERALLREVHHRVKNNLQMVASLLNIQARAASDELEARGLVRAHDRVQLMALAHQRIYASGELRGLRLDDLTAEIARQLLQSRGGAGKDIKLELDLGEALVDVDRAVPVTFLIGEALSNSFDLLSDHAVDLHLALREDSEGELRIAISGALTFDGDAPTPSTRLIDAFARQLGAAVGRDPQRPYALWVRIPPAPPRSATGQQEAEQQARAE